jgi:PleD family two-component response regulator
MATVTCPGCRERDEGIATLERRVAELVATVQHLTACLGTNATVSLGVAVADYVGPVQYQQIWDVADDALSQAKQNGRNRFEVRRLRAPHRG